MSPRFYAVRNDHMRTGRECVSVIHDDIVESLLQDFNHRPDEWQRANRVAFRPAIMPTTGWSIVREYV